MAPGLPVAQPRSVLWTWEPVIAGSAERGTLFYDPRRVRPGVGVSSCF